jgi:hypothetical protein
LYRILANQASAKARNAPEIPHVRVICDTVDDFPGTYADRHPEVRF